MTVGELLPVETLQRGDDLLLPLGRVVQVERLDRCDDGRVVVRWHCGPYYRPPHPLAGERRDLGSLRPMAAGETVLGRRNRDPEPPL